MATAATGSSHNGDYGKPPGRSPLEIAEIVRHRAEGAQDPGVAKFASRRVASPAERHGADMARAARQAFGAYRGIGIAAFGCFTGGGAILGFNKGQGDIIGDVGLRANSFSR